MGFSTELASVVQIDVDIFEPQGISKLDAKASFLSEELAAQTIKKSFSGKKVCEEQWGGDGPLGTSQFSSAFIRYPGWARDQVVLMNNSQTFHQLWQISERNHFKEEGIILAHGF